MKPHLRDLYTSVKVLYLAGLITVQQKHAICMRIRRLINRREVAL